MKRTLLILCLFVCSHDSFSQYQQALDWFATNHSGGKLYFYATCLIKPANVIYVQKAVKREMTYSMGFADSLPGHIYKVPISGYVVHKNRYWWSIWKRRRLTNYGTIWIYFRKINGRFIYLKNEFCQI